MGNTISMFILPSYAVLWSTANASKAQTETLIYMAASLVQIYFAFF